MKIVLTGGPSAGKTTVAETLTRTFCDRLAMVPEAASILFRGGFPRWDSTSARRSQQIAIYHVQKELEEMFLQRYRHLSLICDRGSLDGMAYWPGGTGAFLSAVHSSLSLELERYDWVLHLDSARAANYISSPLRLETAAQAATINRKVRNAWKRHPRQIVIHNNTDFDVKLRTTVEVVKMILMGKTIDEVRAFTQRIKR